jgi:hypothetical protein
MTRQHTHTHIHTHQAELVGGPESIVWTCLLACLLGVLLQPTDRDRVEGSWCAYHAVGGAITVLTAVSAGA